MSPLQKKDRIASRASQGLSLIFSPSEASNRSENDNQEGSDPDMAEEIVEAPMVGRVIRIHVQNGNPVNEGDRICDIEALKMEIPILAPVSGKIKEIHVSPGQKINGGDPLVIIER